jgi:ribonuclease HI
MPLADFLKNQEISPNQWDLLLFGDGSGSDWKGAGGYSAFMIDGRRRARACILGGRSYSTVNRMELTAYTEALSYHYYKLLDETVTDPPYKVWVFTDSEYTAKCGSRTYSRKANLDLWTVADWYETRGYRIRWRWVPRNSNPLHAAADRLSGAAREALKPTLLSDDDLYRLLPDVSIPVSELKVTLVQCERCKAPMLPAEPECPQCGLLRKDDGGVQDIR